MTRLLSMDGELERATGGQDASGSDREVDGVGPDPSVEGRLAELLDEFQRRQRRRPDLVVRPWWTPGENGGTNRTGFVVEYCPNGRDSVHLVVREHRVTVDGPDGATEAELTLRSGWVLGGLDTRSPETLANHLLRLADRVLGERPDPGRSTRRRLRS